MKISQFVTLNSFHKHFGHVRVADTTKRIRKTEFVGLSAITFPLRTTEVDPITAGVFVYTLLAQRGPKDVPAIVNVINTDAPWGEDPNGNHTPIHNVIGNALFDYEYLNKIRYIEVSKLDGSAWVYYEGGHPQGAPFIRESAKLNQTNLDYDGRTFDHDAFDVRQKISKRFLFEVYNELKDR
jgi:hypothetical protein